MTGRQLLIALAAFPLDHLDREVVVETGTDTPDVPLVDVAMTGPGPGVLLLTTGGPR